MLRRGLIIAVHTVHAQTASVLLIQNDYFYLIGKFTEVIWHFILINKTTNYSLKCVCGTTQVLLVQNFLWQW